MAQNLLMATSNLPAVLAAQQIPATETVIYQCPAASAVKIASAVLCNTTSNSVTVSVSLVKAAAGVGGNNTNRVLSSYSLAGNDSLILTELIGSLLGPNDLVSAVASTASAVAFVISGAVST